jgi:hypothetical protein
VQQATQRHALGGDHATPHAVLADIPVPKRQREALGAHRARYADGDRCGRLTTGLPDLHVYRKPVFGIKPACCAAGVPDDLHPQELIGKWHGHRPIWRPGSGPVRGARGRTGILRCRGTRNSHVLLLLQDTQYREMPDVGHLPHAGLAPWQSACLTSWPDQRPGVGLWQKASTAGREDLGVARAGAGRANPGPAGFRIILDSSKCEVRQAPCHGANPAWDHRDRVLLLTRPGK